MGNQLVRLIFLYSINLVSIRKVSILFKIEACIIYLPKAYIRYSMDKNMIRNAEVEQKDSFRIETNNLRSY